MTVKIFEANAVTQEYYLAENSLGFHEESNGLVRENGLVQITSDSVPGWYRLLKSGGLATGAMTAAGYKTTRTQCAHSVQAKFPRYGYPGQFYEATEVRNGIGNMQAELGLPPLPSPDTMRRLSDEAYIDLIQKVKALRQEFQAGVFLGELPETLHGLGTLSEGLHSLFRSKQHEGERLVQQLKGASPKKLADRLSEWWLSWSFGVKPTLSDVADLSRSLAAIHNRGGNLESEFVKASSKSDEVTYSDVLTLVRGLQKTEAGFKATKHAKVKLGCVVSAFSAGPVMAHEIVGFEPSEFIPTVWELLPYSWLVDYFTNVGDVLAAWSDTTFSGAELIQVTTVQRSTVDRILHRSDTANHIRDQGGVLISETFNPGQVKRERFFINRQKVRSRTLLPSFRFQLPSWKQGATAAAFFWQRFT